MILLRPENHFSTICRGTTSRLRPAALNSLMILFAVSLLFGALEFAVAQDIFGRIVGTVTDSSGGAVPNVKVTIVNEATKVPRALTADKNGYFVADSLPVGTYTVTAEQKGFKTTEKVGNVLVAGGRLTVDLGMEVGAVTETVHVEAIGDTVNTTSGEISTTIDFQQMQNMAFNDVGIDFIREVDIQSSNFSAEYGRSASAQVNVVTRSGGDQYHGTAFEYVRNQIFDAANAGTKLTSL